LSIFLKLVLKRPHSHTNLIELAEIKREEKKIDLTIKWKEEGILKCIFIENKMKSIPDNFQLKSYDEKIDPRNDKSIRIGTSKLKQINEKKLLLTPFPVDPEKFVTDSILKWENISYKHEIINFLELIKKVNFKNDNENNVSLFICKYSTFLEKQFSLLENLHLDEKNEVSLFQKSYGFFYDSILRDTLSNIKLNDLVLKLFHDKIRLKLENNILYARPNIDKKIFRFYSGLSHETGITDIKICINEQASQYICLQLQAYDLKYGVEVIPIIKKQDREYTEQNKIFAEKLLRTNKLNFFDLTSLKGEGKEEKLKMEINGKTINFCSYSMKFIYLKRTLANEFKEKPIEDLILFITQETLKILDNISIYRKLFTDKNYD